MSTLKSWLQGAYQGLPCRRVIELALSKRPLVMLRGAGRRKVLVATQRLTAAANPLEACLATPI